MTLTFVKLQTKLSSLQCVQTLRKNLQSHYQITKAVLVAACERIFPLLTGKDPLLTTRGRGDGVGVRVKSSTKKDSATLLTTI